MTTSTKTSKAKKSLASKPDAATIQKATEKAKAKNIAMLRAYTIAANSRTPYAKLQKNRAVFSAWIIAAAATAKVISITPQGAIREAKGGSMALFAALVGNTARGHWERSGRIDGSGMTVAGLNEFTARLNGITRGYNTDIEKVRALRDAQTKGMERLEIDNLILDVTGTVAVKA